MTSDLMGFANLETGIWEHLWLIAPVIGGLHPIVSAGDGQVIQKGLLGVYPHDLLCVFIVFDITGKEDF